MIVAHATAIKERLEQAFAGTAVAVYDGQVPDRPAAQYVVLWTSAPARSTDRLSGTQDNADQRWQTTCCATDVDQARAIQQVTTGALVDARLTVPGRQVARVKHEGAQPLREDTDEHHPTWLLAVDTWSLFSIPHT